MKYTLIILFALLSKALFSQDNPSPQPLNIPLSSKPDKPWSLNFSGFIQADVIVDNRKATYIDGFLPTYISSNETDYNSYLTFRQSQFELEVNQHEAGIKGFIQIDFVGPNNRNEFRLRKLYVTYKNWKVGQDWSTVDDITSWPNIVDLNGPNGAVFGRRMFIRYTKELNENNKYEIALEDPAIPSISVPHNNLWKTKTLFPNLVGTYKYGHRSYIRAAGIINPISYDTRNTESEDFKTKTTVGLGVNFTSRIYVGPLSNFKFSAFTGKGVVTRLTALANEGYDAVVDLSGSSKELNKNTVLSVVGTYEQWWNSKWSSVLFYNYTTLGIKDGNEKDFIKNINHAGFSSMYQPTSYFKTGVDLIYASVKRQASAPRIDASRIQLSAAFMF